MGILGKALEFLADDKPDDWGDYYFKRSKKIAIALHPFGVPLLEKEKELSEFFDTTKEPDIFDSRKLIPIIPSEKSELLDTYTLVIEGGIAVGVTAKVIDLPNDNSIAERLYKESAKIIADGINESFQGYEIDAQEVGAFMKQWDIRGESKNDLGPNYYNVVQILLERLSEYDPEDFATNVFESPETLRIKDSNFRYTLSYFYKDTFTNLRGEQIEYYRKLYDKYMNFQYSDLSNAEKKEYSEKIFSGKLEIT